MDNQQNNNQESSLSDNGITDNNENMRQQGNKKNIKQILIAVFIVFAVLICSILVWMTITKPDPYMKGNLSVYCQKDDSCCRSSHESAKRNMNNIIIDKNEQCPVGYTREQLRCIGSLVWCEPTESSRSMAVGDIKYPEHDRGIAIKLNIDDEGFEMLDEYKVVNGYPNYYPGTYEFIAELIDDDNNLLGEYGFSDPRLIQAEMGYDGPSSVESIDFTLIIPYLENASKVNIYQKGSLKLTVDIVSTSSERTRPDISKNNQSAADNINCFIVDQFFDLFVFDKEGNIIKRIGDSRDYFFNIVKNKIYYGSWENIKDVFWLSCDGEEIQTGKLDLNNPSSDLLVSNKQDKIAYVKMNNQDNEYSNILYVKNIAGGNEVKLLELTNKGERWIKLFGWSDDDKYLYIGILPEGLGGRIMYPGMMNLEFMDIATKERIDIRKLVNEIIPEEYSKYYGNFQAISSDQRYIAYELTDYEGELSDKLFIVDIEDKKYYKKSLSDTKARPVNIRFSPDNNRIVYNEFFDNLDDEDKSYMRVVISDIDGDNILKLGNDHKVLNWNSDYVLANEYLNRTDNNIINLFLLSPEDGKVVSRYELENNNSKMGTPRITGVLTAVESGILGTEVDKNVFTHLSRPGERIGDMVLDKISSPEDSIDSNYVKAEFTGTVSLVGTLSAPTGNPEDAGMGPEYSLGNLTQESIDKLPYFEGDTRTVWFGIQNPEMMTEFSVQNRDLVEMTINKYIYVFYPAGVWNSAVVTSVEKIQ